MIDIQTLQFAMLAVIALMMCLVALGVITLVGLEFSQARNKPTPVQIPMSWIAGESGGHPPHPEVAGPAPDENVGGDATKGHYK